MLRTGLPEVEALPSCKLAEPSYQLGFTVPPATRLAGNSFAGPPRANSSMAALAISSAGDVHMS